ncbi:MAG: ABC transporter ATP-binding protein [Candidatus Rokubacteria bacterium]|nr:ABC transporter ATP-binding protein [Candidatus Rokubacteria bacterium]
MLRLEGLRAAYGRIEALKGVSLEVRAGELVTLIGANGAGKTSTLKAISGTLRSSDGRILFEGNEIHRLTPREILTRGIAHCPEGRRVFPYMTVRENLEMGAYARADIHGIREDLERVFAHFPILGERLRQAAGTLSGGEQQMLAIGRALMARPRLLLLDEPSLGLAPTVIETTLRIIREVRQRGVTVLMVEQNAYLALRMADRGYVMETGQIALEGKAGDLIENEHVKRAYLGG